MKIQYVFMAINLSGLILDLVGFIKIYNTKLNWIQKIDSSNVEYLGRLQYSGNKPSSELILERVNRKIDDINSNYVSHQASTAQYFRLIYIGVILQIISAFSIVIFETLWQ